MKVERINNYANINANSELQHKKVDQNYARNNVYAISSLEHLAALNKPNFTGKKYEIGLSHDELVKRTSDTYLAEVTLLNPSSPQYLNLAEGDKKALKHLVKAADIIGIIEKKLDDENNLPFEAYLKKEIKKGNKDAVMAKTIYDAQRGVFAKDNMMNNVSLAKGLKISGGMGVYPRDLSVEEFHKILTKMLKEGKDKKVRNMLNQRTVVVRDGKELKGIDYVDKYRKEFKLVADEIEKAAKYSTDKDFNEYLILQAKAFRKADPMLDAKADMKWAELQDTPLEFSIPRENYEDRMTMSIFENKELMSLLREHDITPIPKDNLGCRVGIVNKEGTAFLLRSKSANPILAQRMPFADKYPQNIGKDNKQAMVEADLISVTGNVGEWRGKITLAENLPNNDKLSVKLGGGKRNVYHKQMRMPKPIAYSDVVEESQRNCLDPKYYHMWTIGHENGHSLGPKHVDKLGKYRNIIEENKADMVSMAFLDDLTDMGIYSKEDRDAILANFVLTSFLTVKPDMSIAHRVRSVMQQKMFEDNGVYEFTPDGKIFVNVDKVVPAARKMLEEIVEIQMNNDYDAAEEYVNKYFVWTPKMEYVAQKIQENSKILNGTVKMPLAEYLLNEEI